MEECDHRMMLCTSLVRVPSLFYCLSDSIEFVVVYMYISRHSSIYILLKYLKCSIAIKHRSKRGNKFHTRETCMECSTAVGLRKVACVGQPTNGP